MKMKTAVGSFTGLFLSLQILLTPAAYAEAPKYDATGMWNIQVTEGWTDCGFPVLEESGTVEIIQSGDTFKFQIGSGTALNGFINGSRYHFIKENFLDDWARTQSVTWDLDSSSVGSGHSSTVIVTDGYDLCTIISNFNLQKQGDCTPTDTQMCLQNGRFSVTVTWGDEHGATGVGHAIPSTDDSGLFWFFSESNMELLIKVLDGCGINNRYWVFFAATTDQQFTVRITDLETDELVEYTNPLKHAADAVTDTDAFATCP